MKIEMHKVIGSWYEITISIYDFIMDIGQVFSIRSDNMLFFDKANIACLLSSCHGITGNLFARLISSNCYKCTRFISNLPLQIELTIFTFLVTSAISSLFLNEGLLTK